MWTLGHDPRARRTATEPPVAGEELLRSDAPLGVSPPRRCLDVVAAGGLLVLLSPVLGVAAVLVLLTDGRPVFFTQLRCGEGRQPFRLLKLRTMRTGVPGPAVTACGDPRVTRVGAVLRRTSIDELPQLWHVVRGQMTLVGPRPESLELADRYPPSCQWVLYARPGLTGPAQLMFRERSAVPQNPTQNVEAWYLATLVPLRTAADLSFLQRPGLLPTLRYLGLTALFVVGLVDLQQSANLHPSDAARQLG